LSPTLPGAYPVGRIDDGKFDGSMESEETTLGSIRRAKDNSQRADRRVW
jgi:hypothetical protein